MKKGKLYQKLASSFAWLLAVALLISMSVGAATTESVDTSKKDCSITIQFEKGSTSFRLYRVASIDGQTKFTLVDPFTNYSVEVNGLDTSGYSDLALTLGNYATSDDLTPTATGMTDETGAYKFENLETGMYLLIGTTVTEAGTQDGKSGSYYYAPTASIIIVPTWETQADGGDMVYNYDPTVTVKYETRWVEDEYVDDEQLKVTKQWDYSEVSEENLEEAKANEPSSVSVSILQDGQVFTDESGTDYSNIVLDESNDWTWEKTDLPEGYTYSAVENNTDSSYVVSISQTENVVTITNTRKRIAEIEYVETESEGTTETPTATTEGSSSSTSSTTDSSTKLPQTGQLWWPVPILALVGLVLFGAGGFRRSRSEKKEK